MAKLKRSIPAAQFKAECLHLINTVHDQHVSYVITKRGKPFAKLIPIIEEGTNYFGFMKDTSSTSGDIVGPIDLEWDAEK